MRHENNSMPRKAGRNYDNNLAAHQMVGGPKAAMPHQGQKSNKEQENPHARHAHHAEEMRVPVYKFEGRGNKIC